MSERKATILLEHHLKQLKLPTFLREHAAVAAVYEASLELGRKLAKQAAMKAVGKTDVFEQHRQIPISKHLEEFIEGLRCGKRSPRYVMQVENRIRLILKDLKVGFLHELDPVAVGRFLSNLAHKRGLSGITQNEYITSIKSFTKWAVTFRRMKDDPLAGLKMLERKAIEPAHPRRALSMAEIARLLDAAQCRPLLELQTVRIGLNAGKQVAKVKSHSKAKAIHLGRERRMVYLLAVWTGLRRSEIRQLTWGDIHLENIPGKIMLRAKTTKSKRADSLPVHPQLAEELLAWRPDSVTPDELVFSTVPSMKCLRADLMLAGIACKDDAGRYADFHGLRVSLSTMLAANKVSPRATQAMMRHTDPRLTAGVYTDEKLLPLAAEIQSVPAIPGGRHDVISAHQPDLDALVAGLSIGQRQTLIKKLRLQQVG